MRVIELLEGLAVARVAGHIAHEQHHRRGVLESGVHADRGVGGAGAARDKAHPRSAGQAALGFGHEGRPTLLAASDELDAVAVQMKTVEHGQVAFAWHAKRMGNALGQEAFDKQVAGKWCSHAGIVQSLPIDSCHLWEAAPAAEGIRAQGRSPTKADSSPHSRKAFARGRGLSPQIRRVRYVCPHPGRHPRSAAAPAPHPAAWRHTSHGP